MSHVHLDEDLEVGSTELRVNLAADQEAEPELGCCGWIIVSLICFFPAVLMAIFVLVTCVICFPCLLCMFCDRIKNGRTVTLNGTEPLEVGNVARDAIEQSKQGAGFHARMDNFSGATTYAIAVSRELSASFSGRSRSGIMPAPGHPVQPDGVNLNEKRQTFIDVRKKMLKKEIREQSLKPMPGYLSISVRRDHLLEESLKCLGSAATVDLLAKYLCINYVGEKGIDAGGLRRDWFDSLGEALVAAAEDGNGHMIAQPDKTLTPRPHEARSSDLFALGRLAGLAMWFGIPLNVPLGSTLCKFILEEPIGMADIQRLDPDFYQFRIKPVLQPNGAHELAAALGEPLTFMSAATDVRESQELCKEGSSKHVTEENKFEYVKLLAEHYLCGNTREQISIFLNGFRDICPKDALIRAGISYRELALLICGRSSLDADAWRAHTIINSYNSDHDQVINWFWEMVVEMSNDDRAQLLHFATGSSRLPSSGFEGVTPRFNITISGEDTKLPVAHTCGNQLVIPRYGENRLLKDKFAVALANDEGFGLW